MFKIGEHIVYGTNGVCRVMDVCSSPIDQRDGRTYYVLKPVNGSSTSLIYTPVDNDRVSMRALLTAEEIYALLSRIPAIPGIPIPTEKARREAYRAAMSAGSLDSYVSVIKTVSGRRAELSAAGRRLPEFEIEYDGAAKRHLYTELSVVLGLPFDEMEQYVASHAAVAAV